MNCQGRSKSEEGLSITGCLYTRKAVAAGYTRLRLYIVVSKSFALIS